MSVEIYGKLIVEASVEVSVKCIKNIKQKPVGWLSLELKLKTGVTAGVFHLYTMIIISLSILRQN